MEVAVGAAVVGVEVVIIGGGFLLVKEGAGEVGEEERVEVAEPEEGLLEGVAPRLVEELVRVGVGGGV